MGPWFDRCACLKAASRRGGAPTGLNQRPLVLSEICTTVDCEPTLISTEIGKAPAGTAVVISDWVLAS